MSSPALPPPEAGPRALDILGVPIHDVTEREVVAWAIERARSGRPGHVVTSNLDFLYQAHRDPEMHRIHVEADLVIPDGMPLIWLSRVLGPPLRERVAGSDLVPLLAEAARDHGLSVYEVGAAPGVAERALRLLQERDPGLRVAGCEAPPAAPVHGMDDEDLVRRLEAARPDFLFVAFGAPKQEKWIRLHDDRLRAAVMIGVGGSLDFLAGTQARAPRWTHRLGLEWLWRMMSQPRRLFRRYRDDFLFLASMIARIARLRLAPAGAARMGPRGAAGALTAGRGPLAPLCAAARSPFTVIDLAARTWLDSADLGALAALARRCREAGGRLCLVGRAPRVDALLRLLRLDRHLELPGTAADLERLLDAPDGTPEVRKAGDRLLVRLPAEFSRDAVARVRAAFLRHWHDGGAREVVVDASAVRYIDGRGARFLLAAQRLVEREPGRSLWLLGFPAEDLRRLRREGVDAVREDRRRRFRDAAPSEGRRA